MAARSCRWMVMAVVAEALVAMVAATQMLTAPAIEVGGQVGTGMQLAPGAAGGSSLASLTAKRRLRILSVTPIGHDERLRYEGFLLLGYSRERRDPNPAGCQMSISSTSDGSPFGYFLRGRQPVIPKDTTVELIGTYRAVGGEDKDQPQLRGWRLTYRLEPWSPVRTLELPKSAAWPIIDATSTTKCDLTRLDTQP